MWETIDNTVLTTFLLWWESGASVVAKNQNYPNRIEFWEICGIFAYTLTLKIVSKSMNDLLHNFIYMKSIHHTFKPQDLNRFLKCYAAEHF